MFLSTHGNAQIEVLFETNQSYTMLIGFDGFMQTPKPVSKAVIAQIAPGEHMLQVIALGKDTISFTKTINLYEKEKQHYILTRDYNGTIQLQYRGIIARFPLEAPIIKQQKLVVWKGIDSKTPIKTIATKNEQPVVKTVVKKDSTIVAIAKIQTSAVAAAVTITAKKDSLNKLLNEPKSNTSFVTIVKMVSNSASEFEKLNALQKYTESNMVSITELSELARLLRFDDSRLQFLLKAKPLVTPEEKIILENVFQFEYTKKAYINTVK